MSLGADVEGTDWSYDTATHVETRHYTGGTMEVLLDGEPMIGGVAPDLTVLLDHRDLADCADDAIDGFTDAMLPVDQFGASSAGVRAAAAALLQDVGAFGFWPDFTSLQPAAQTQFMTDNRVGAYFETSAGEIHIGDTPIGP
jgi:hypothetical protein